MSEGTRVFSNTSGLDALPAKYTQTMSSSLTSPGRSKEAGLPNGNVSHSRPHTPQSPSNRSQGYGSDSGKGENSSLKSAGSSPGRTLSPKSILTSKHIRNHFSSTANGNHIPGTYSQPTATDEDFDSSRPKPSVLRQVKIRPSPLPTIKPGNGFSETVFKVPSPVLSKTISWGSDDNVGDVRYQNSTTSSPARVSLVSAVALPQDSGERRASAASSKASMTNCLPVHLTAETRPVISPSKSNHRPVEGQATQSRDQTITGILKTPTRGTSNSIQPVTSSASIISAVDSGTNVKNTDFSSNSSLKVFATTLSGEDMFTKDDKTSSVLLNGGSKFHISSQDLSDNRSVTFQADQMSQVFSRFKALFDGSDAAPADKLDRREEDEESSSQTAHKASSACCSTRPKNEVLQKLHAREIVSGYGVCM